MTVIGPLDLDHVAIPFPLGITDSRVVDPVSFRYASVPNLDLSRSEFSGIDLDGTSIGANAVLAGVTINGSLQAIGIEVAAHLDLQDAVLNNPGGVALGLDGSRIGIGAVWKRLTAVGRVSVIGVHVGAELDLQMANLTNEGASALSLDRTVIDGSLNLTQVVVKGTIRAIDAHVGSQFSLQNAEIEGTAGRALNLTHARIDGGAFLSGMKAKGEVRLIAARIGGQLSMRDADVVADGATALLLDGLKVEGKAILAALTVSGRVTAVSGHIAGQLDLENSRIAVASGSAVHLDRIRVEHGVSFKGLVTTGTLAAPAAHISGGILLDEATLNGAKSAALNLDGCRIEGDAALTGLSAAGTVSMADAHVAGRISFEGAALVGGGGCALQAGKLVANKLDLKDIGKVTGSVDLTGANIDDLVVSDRWPQEGPPGTLQALGWHVRDVHGVLRNDWRAATAWLDTGGDGKSTFLPQPWHALADVYEGNGQPSEARKIRYQAAMRSTKAGPAVAKPIGWTYRFLVGYGYYPLLAGAWLILAILSAWLVIYSNGSDFVPTNPTLARASLAAAEAPANMTPRALPDTATATASPMPARGRPRVTPTPAPQDSPTSPAPRTQGGRALTGDIDCAHLTSGYPCLAPALYALEIVLPASAATGQTAAWRPSTPAVAYILTGLKAFGWLLTALLLAGVTGLLRKT